MPRRPSPPTGAALDETFAQRYAEAITENPEVHDGAIMAGRVKSRAEYRVLGWSYRLFPPEGDGEVKEYLNHGSAFHSALAMSATPGVDGMILFARGERLIFSRGRLISAVQIPR